MRRRPSRFQPEPNKGGDGVVGQTPVLAHRARLECAGYPLLGVPIAFLIAMGPCNG